MARYSCLPSKKPCASAMTSTAKPRSDCVHMDGKIPEWAGSALRSLRTRTAFLARSDRQVVRLLALVRLSPNGKGRKPASIAADASYGNGEFLQWLVDREITPYMPTRDAVGRTRSSFYGRRKRMISISCCKTNSPGAVTAEVAGSSPVVPARMRRRRS
jgi:hypothetical protein